MSNRQFSKYVSENMPFAIDWTNALSNANNGVADTIATSTWQAQDGITIVSSTTSGYEARVRVSGGTGGNIYRLENSVTLTSSGYTRMDYLEIRVLSDPVNP